MVEDYDGGSATVENVCTALGVGGDADDVGNVAETILRRQSFPSRALSGNEIFRCRRSREAPRSHLIQGDATVFHR